ncbi:orofacial cleft 1 candidate gene 1 protein-like [Tamandua tetradactyla]|uniref:orofacial cleft 1 candidate gene 1 protein-like n=1 Tax=Tamandua tetradactyla TaxID=48850 RepID=UPI00405487F9
MPMWKGEKRERKLTKERSRKSLPISSGTCVNSKEVTKYKPSLVSLQKFQQKALKQTKQKKSKSAEFLMVKEDREAAQGIANPAFNMSSPDLSAYQTSGDEIIRHDMPDRTLAAPQQKLRLRASAEAKGNEYSRNYFDPLMDEEINPRQCRMEVSGEDIDGIFYNQLMKLLEETECEELQDKSIKAETLDSEVPMSSSASRGCHKETEEVIPSYAEEFERYAQKDVVLLSSSSLKQEVLGPPKADGMQGKASDLALEDMGFVFGSDVYELNEFEPLRVVARINGVYSST